MRPPRRRTISPRMFSAATRPSARESQTLPIIRDVARAEKALASVPKGETVAVASKRLLNHLKSVRTSLTSQDWSTLADTLEYDLCAEADAWVKLLSALADHVGELPAMNSPSDTQTNSEAKHS